MPAGTGIRIDAILKVGEQRRAALKLVEDGFWGELTQNAAGILGGEGASIGFFQGKVGGIGCDRPGQSRLAGLTGTGDEDDNAGGQTPPKEQGDQTRNRMGWRCQSPYGQTVTGYTGSQIIPGPRDWWAVLVRESLQVDGRVWLRLDPWLRLRRTA